jgi:hypothetical protein
VNITLRLTLLQSSSRAARLAILLALVALLLVGCITIQGQSSWEMKEAMLHSFLFRSADIFYPDGPPADPDRLPDMRPRQVSEIEKIFAAIMDGLRNLHGEQAEVLRGVFDRTVPTTLRTQFTLTNTGQPYARISPNGDIVVDVKVAQAIYRTALLSGLQEGGPGGARFMDWDKEHFGKRPTTEAEHIELFLKFKQQVVSLPGRDMLGDLVGSLKDDSFEGGWYKMSRLAMISSTVERHYFGPIQFLLAHELGHGALGHLEKRKSIADNDCEALQMLELEADAYAVSLLSFAAAKKGLMAFGFDLFGIKASLGFEDFFKYTYELSGFERAPGASTCGHPEVADRLKTVELLYEAARKAQSDADMDVFKRKLEEADARERGSR